MKETKVTEAEKQVIEAVEISATDERNDSIENSVPKNNIRQDLISQIEPVISVMKKTEVTLLGLPCKHAYFENALSHALRRKNVNTQLNFVGVEKAKSVTPEAFWHMPPNSKLAGNCTLEDFLKYETEQNKAGYLVLTDEERIEHFMIDIGWFDYCGYATNKNIKHFAETIHNSVKQGYMALTFSLNTRPISPEVYKKKLCGYKKGLNLRETIIRSIEMANRIFNKDKKIELVLNEQYGGGVTGRTTMLTLGYTINIKKNVVTPIVDDLREGISELRAKRVGTYYKLSNLGKKEKFVIGKRGGGKAKKIKKILTAEEKRIKQAAGRWESKWRGLSREKKLKIATKYGRTVGSFGSMTAHYHGDLGLKKLAREKMMKKSERMIKEIDLKIKQLKKAA